MWPACVFMFAHLNSESLDVIGAVRSAREVWQVELDLVPAVVQPHGHRTDEGLHSRRALIVTRPEPPPHILIIQHLKSQLCDIHHVFWLIFYDTNWNIIKTLPELQMWNTSWDSWWSWRGRAVWCQGFSWGLRDTWCRWCCGEQTHGSGWIMMITWSGSDRRTVTHSPDIRSLHLQHQRLDVIICDALDVSVSDLQEHVCLLSYLQKHLL